jgi:hypothetical protein
MAGSGRTRWLIRPTALYALKLLARVNLPRWPMERRIALPPSD